MENIAGLHFQYIPDSGEMFDRLVFMRKPFIAFLVPNLLDKNMKTPSGGDICGRIHPKIIFYPEIIKKKFSENKDNPNIFWVQEGYRHCCEKCFELREYNLKKGEGFQPDPHHEHVCLDGHTEHLVEQLNNLSKGRGLIKKVLGINVLGYCAPNHLYNQNTFSATESLDFQYFISRNGFGYLPRDLTELPAYKESKNLIVVPESKFEQSKKSPIISTYYDHLVDRGVDVDVFFKILGSSVPLSKLEIVKKPNLKVRLSNKLVYLAKKHRDRKAKEESQHQ